MAPSSFLKFTLTLLACLLCTLLPKHAVSQSWEWARSGGSIGTDGDCTGVAADLFGNSFITGTGFGPMTFGTYSITSGNFYLVKYDAQSNVKWVKSAQYSNYTASYGITTDNLGNVIVTGFFNGDSILFDTIKLTGHRNTMFVVKYDSLGNVLWARVPISDSSTFGYEIATDNNNNIVMYGKYEGDSIRLGSYQLSGSNCFLAKYDPNGNVIWAINPFLGYGGGFASICIDKAGYIYITGDFDDPEITFGNITLRNHSSGPSLTPDVFYVKFDPGGHVVWAKSASGGDVDFALKIAVDDNYNVYLVGETGGYYIRFDPIDAGIPDGRRFLVQLDSSGSAKWVQSTKIFNIIPDNCGGLYATNYYYDSISFGRSLLSSPRTNRLDLYVAKFDTLGNAISAIQAGGIGDDMAILIAANKAGEIFIAGKFSSPTCVFGGIGISKHSSNIDEWDAFIAKASPISDAIPQIPNTPQKLQIYPNPNSGEMTVQLLGIYNHITITDCLGRYVYTRQLNGTEKTVDINMPDAVPGVYYLHLTGVSGSDGAVFVVGK